MTTYTPILNLPEVAPNQTQKEATINTAIAILEAAMNDTLVVSLATGDVTFTTDQFTKYFHHQFTGHTVARTVTIPETPRWFSVENQGTATVTIKSADPSTSTQVCVLPAGKIGLIVSDGHDLRFVVPDPTGGIGSLEDLSNVTGSPTNGQLLRYVSADGKWEPWTLSVAFSDLSDFPGPYGANASKLLAVKPDGSGLEWVTSAANITHFTDLLDVPNSYNTAANLTVKVNSGATGLIFSRPKLTEAADFPSSFSGAAGKFAQVDPTATSLVFSTVNLEDIVDGPGAPATGDALKYVQVSADGSHLVYGVGTGGPDAFIQLTDTPHNYTSFGKQYPRVKATEDGLEFHAVAFIDLADTPNSLTGQQSKFVAVNATGNAIEFRTARVGDLSDGPGSYQFKAKQVVRVNANGTAWEYGIVAITDLSGFPSSLTGQGGKFLQVKADETGIQFSTSSFSTSFLALTDTPDDYTGQANKYIAVNGSANGLEFRTFPTIPTNLDDLHDVDNSTGTPDDGAVLTLREGIWRPEVPQAVDVPQALGDLTDVDLSTGTPAENDVLTYSNGVWNAQPPTGGSGGGSSTLAGLTDVDLTTNPPTDQQALIYDLAENKWVPGSVAAGGGGSGGSIPVPVTVVQTATARVANASDTAVNVTFGANTTVGNTIVFLVNGYNASVGVSGYTPYELTYNGTIVSNQQVAVMVIGVTSATNAYTVTITNPNGGMNIVALEVEDLATVELNALVPALTNSSKTLTTFFLAEPGQRNYLMFENDQNGGALTSYTSGLGLIYDAYAGSVNHSGSFFSVPDSLLGQNVTATYTAVLNSPIAAIVTLSSGRFVEGAVIAHLYELLDVNIGTGTPANGEVLTYEDGLWVPMEPTSGGSSDVAVFTDLTDVPQSYASQAKKLVMVNDDETGLEFVDSIFYKSDPQAARAHRYWRYTGTTHQSSWTGCCEFGFYTSSTGANLATSTNLTTNIRNYSPGQLTDGNTGSGPYGNGTLDGNNPYIIIDLGIGVRQPCHHLIIGGSPADFSGEMVTAELVEYSDDGSTWNTAWTDTQAMSPNTLYTYTNPTPTGSGAYGGEGGKALRVKLDETDVEWYEPTLADLYDVEFTSGSPAEHQVLSFAGGTWAPRTIHEFGGYAGSYDANITGGSATFDSGYPADFEEANTAGWTIVPLADSGASVAHSLKSKHLPDVGYTSFFVNIYSSTSFGIPGLTGRYKISAASTGTFKIIVDGVTKVTQSGNPGAFANFDTGSLADGHHVVEFRYEKTAETVAGDDAVYISYVSYATLPNFYKSGEIVDFNGARFMSLVDYPLNDPTDTTEWQGFGSTTLTGLSDVSMLNLPEFFPLGVRYDLAYNGFNFEPYLHPTYRLGWGSDSVVDQAMDFEDGTIPQYLSNAQFTWTVVSDTDTANSRTKALKSNPQGDNNTVTWTFYVAAPDDGNTYSVTINYRTSTEASADIFTVSMDGVAQFTDSGVHTTYTSQSFNLPIGAHTIEIKYAKNASGSAGDDAVYINFIDAPFVVSPYVSGDVVDWNGGRSMCLTDGTISDPTSDPLDWQSLGGTNTVSEPYLGVTTATVSSYTLALTDHASIKRFSDPTGVAVSIPNNSTVAFPVGTEILFKQNGAGQITVSAVSGVTLNFPSDMNARTRIQHSMMTLIKVDTNEWDLAGDLDPS